MACSRDDASMERWRHARVALPLSHARTSAAALAQQKVVQQQQQQLVVLVVADIGADEQFVRGRVDRKKKVDDRQLRSE